MYFLCLIFKDMKYSTSASMRLVRSKHVLTSWGALLTSLMKLARSTALRTLEATFESIDAGSMARYCGRMVEALMLDEEI